MDLRVYYQKLRQAEASIADAHVVVVSLETGDGGRAGVYTEVGKPSAARMVVEGRARLASAEEAVEFRERVTEAKRQADQAAAANRLQFAVLSETDLKALRKPSGGKA